MCGISGFIDYKKNTQLHHLEKMNRTLGHRGPDGEGYKIFNNPFATVGLGHKRLSIIDLTENGSQPQSYTSLHITYNGEIYNHAELRKELEQKGHQFNSYSDTEVILHAYAEWGPQCLQKFIGMFAFVIYDEAHAKVFACRDRAGVKPFNYYLKDNLFLFGSELKAIMAHPSFAKNIDINAVGAYMQYGYIPAPHTIFNNTYKLKPGHYLEINLATQSFQTHQYWSVYQSYNKKTLSISLPDAVEQTERLLTNAFQYRMVSDVPVGVFLSGGYDSALVTALLQKNNTEKIKTFTIGMPEAGLNEAPFAKEIAKYLGTDHTEHYCTEKEALEIVPTLPFFYDEPFADSSAIPTILVSKIAREKVTVALSADAGDEIFAGYNRYDYIVNYATKFKSIPSPLRKLMAGAMNIIPPKYIPGIKGNKSRFDKVHSMLKDASNKNIVSAMSTHFTDIEIQNLFLQKIQATETAFDSKALIKKDSSILENIMAIDYETYLADDILQKVDRAGMSVSLEGREPFLDHRIIDWAAQLPMQYKYNNGSKKFILKEILHKHIPKEMMDRPKSGFGIPIATWLRSDLKPFVETYIELSFLEQQNIFNAKSIIDLKDAFYIGGQNELAEKIWFVLMFQMWYKEWM
jgi:asparagine synthase (glutamine-hydrolysing)